MDRQFTLSCCSTVDLPYSYMESRDIPVLFYTYVVDGVEYDDDMGRDPEALPRFYRFIQEGKLPQTSQINVATYTAFFEELLRKGDLLHIAFTSGQSGSVHNALLAAEELRQKYPDRKLIVIDSLCSSAGYGLLVDSAADMRDAGHSLDEVAQWVLDNRNRVHHQFFSSNMTQFRRTGRVSGAAATVATVLNICPIMRLDDTGSIKAYSKVRGKKKAVEVTVDTMEQCAEGGRDYDASASCATPSVRRTPGWLWIPSRRDSPDCGGRSGCATSAPSSAPTRGRAPWRCSSTAARGPGWTEYTKNRTDAQRPSCFLRWGCQAR